MPNKKKKAKEIEACKVGSLTVYARGKYFHARGTIGKGPGRVRVRQSLGVRAHKDNEDEAKATAKRLEARVRAELGGGPRLSFAENADNFLQRPADDPLGPTDVRVIQELTRHFGVRILWDIPPQEFVVFVDNRQRGNSAETRERYLNTVCAFMTVTIASGQYPSMPPFIRDSRARNPDKRARRPVRQFRQDLIQLIIDCAHLTNAIQFAVEWVGGTRVSSVLHGATLGDLDLTPGRMVLTFRDTKNGDDVPVALPEKLRPTFEAYLDWRQLQVRAGKIGPGSGEALFLHYKGYPYKPNGGAWGTQNKTAFNGAKRRAIEVVQAGYDEKIATMRAAGDLAEVDRLERFKADDVALLQAITQHWLRHKFATDVGRFDPIAAQRQGGWRDKRSLLGYLIPDAEYQRQLVEKRGAPGTNRTQKGVQRAAKQLSR